MTANGQILKLELEKSDIKTAHILHFIMTILTGVWAIVWIIAGLRNNNKRKEIDKKILMLKIDEVE